MIEFVSMVARVKSLVPKPIKNAYHFLQALFGALIFLFPSRAVKVIGVTGTDGKTTTVHLIHHILSESGKSASMISTVEAKIGDKAIDTGLHVTTPEPFKVQSLLRKIANSGSEYAVIEVTSHGLAQERVAFVKFFAGVITNIAHEHLDYHKTYENYVGAKAKLLNNVNYRLLNADDDSYEGLKEKGGGQLVSYGIDKPADFVAKNIRIGKRAVEFEICCERKKGKSEVAAIKVGVSGKYNVYNILAAFAAARSLGIETKKAVVAISNFQGIVGRMQYIDEGQDFDVIVDFAHTPQALKEALETLGQSKKGKLIAVFGSAGERDVGKRAMMGKVATKFADESIFTAEDPRSEDVGKIMNQMAGGALNAGGVADRTFWKIADRATAINTAIGTLAGKDDVVGIFGKGHEKSMNISGVEYPWSDEKIARNALKLRLKK